MTSEAYTMNWQDMIQKLHERFLGRAKDCAFVVGITGGVAAGKTTFAESLREQMMSWLEKPKVHIVSTDGYLFPNAFLAERQLSTRKGFPESYDVPALTRALDALKQKKAVKVPLYSHVTYDVDPSAFQDVSDADVVIVDGLHLGRLSQGDVGRRIDQLVYLDAEEADIELWFRNRLFPLMVAGRSDPNSFYYAFRSLDDVAALDFVSRVWAGINLPNLRDYILGDRDAADVVVRKARDHSLERIEWRDALKLDSE